MYQELCFIWRSSKIKHTYAQNVLIRLSPLTDLFQAYFHQQSSVNINGVIREANCLRQTTPNEIHPEKCLDSFVPLTKGSYPIFNKYPRFIVNYQVRERERIRLEELEYLRER